MVFSRRIKATLRRLADLKGFLTSILYPVREILEQDYEILFINLEYRKDRRRHFESMANRLRIQTTRFSAIRPQNETLFSEYSFLEGRHFSFHMKGENTDHELNIGALGCYLSHRSIVKQLTSQKKFTFVFEDDVQIKRGFFEKALTLIDSIKVEWDILLFDCPSTWNKKDQVEKNIYRPTEGFPAYVGTHAILLRNSSRGRILASLDETYIEAIDTLYLSNHTAIRSLVIRTNLCHPTDFGSDIGLTALGE